MKRLAQTHGFSRTISLVKWIHSWHARLAQT